MTTRRSRGRSAGSAQLSVRSSSLPAARSWNADHVGWFVVAFLALLGVTLVSYFPAWHGGRLWDDDGHLTKAALQSAHGLWRIWFDVGATQQYYPVAHSAFWVMHRIWGDDTLGYHLVNIALHATSAFLLLLILRRLAVPGAAIAALIFALHPVQVESVAWMTELKNTLSGAFYFAAALSYLSFDSSRRRAPYAVAVVLFALALLSKTVTATLPAALLVVFWWQRGTLRWREDIVPTLPFFVCGVASGLGTSWLERTQIGADGPAFQIPLVERCAIAGHAVWFYLSNLAWPAKLIFIYPRWDVSRVSLAQLLFPVAAVIAGVGFLWLRRRSRAPLAAYLLFVGTLVPALGFVNVYPFLFSFVADHFQYLACASVIAIASAGVVVLGRRWGADLDPAPTRTSAAALAALLVIAAPLGVLTWRQSAEYVDAPTLYEATLAANPACWLCENNLGMLTVARVKQLSGVVGTSLNLDDKRALEGAIGQFNDALRLKPDLVQARSNIGSALLALGRLPDAREAFAEAARMKPDDAEVRGNLGLALSRIGQPIQAAAELRESIRLDPTRAAPHATLGETLLAAGDLDGAIAEYREAVRLDPSNADAHRGLGAALGRAGLADEAIGEYQVALQLEPRDPGANANLGIALLRSGRAREAGDRFEAAIAIDPASMRAHYGLASALEAQDRHEEAVVEFRKALMLQPDLAEAHNQLGVALAEIGRPQEAIAEFREAIRLQPDSASARANLARALGGGGLPVAHP